MNKEVEILLLETSSVSTPPITDFYTKLFNDLGYGSKIKLINEKTPQIDKLLNSQVFDVFITDLSLGKDDSYEGLNIIQRIKNEFPEILIIANTSKYLTFAEAASKVPSFDLFVHKSKMMDSKFYNYILSKLSSLFKKNVFTFLDLENSDLPVKISRNKKKIIELNRLLRTITFTSHNSTNVTSVARVVLEPLIAGKSASEVYKMTGFTSKNLPCVNSVLKISKPEEALQEIDNYSNYVKWYLPYTWRSEFINSAFTKNIGAICYAFAYNDDVPFNALTYHISKNDTQKVRVAIDSIFKPSYQRWYHSSNLKKGECLTEYYYKKWFDERSVENSEKSFKYTLRHHNQANPNNIIVNGQRYKMPHSFLLGVLRGEFTSYICHGDLNSNNILISDNNDIVFIDFQNTGCGHVFEDFVVFESCLRLYTNNNMELELLIEAEDHINFKMNAEKKLTFSEEILRLREYARKNVVEENFNNYHYAIALFCYRLLRIPDLVKWQREQIVACLLSNIAFLTNGEKK